MKKKLREKRVFFDIPYPGGLLIHYYFFGKGFNAWRTVRGVRAAPWLILSVAFGANIWDPRGC
jgi:hypothetical protein